MKSWFHEQFFIGPRHNSHQGRFYFLLISSVCLGLCLADGIAEFGDPCDEYKEPCIYSFKCINSRCHCDELLTQLVYTREGAPICAYYFRGSASLFSNDTCYPECTIKQECIKGRCECVEGYVKSQFGPLCHEVVYVKPMQICEVKGNAMLCDPSLYSKCKSSRCICFKNYYYNFTSEECLLKPSGYKALYNEYCRESDDCLEGLSCSDSLSYRCKCPSSCSYNEEFGACDCGEVSIESPILVIVVGCMIGICSVIFWIFCINRTWKKAGYESDSDDIGEDNPLHDIPPGNVFSVEQSITQDAQPNSLSDGPPTYKEALIGTHAAQIGFSINNSTSIVDDASTTKNSSTPYVPFFPPLHSNYQDSQNIPPSSIGNLPYPTSAVNPSAPGNLPYPTSDVNPTAPSLITDHSTNLSPIPYPISPQMQTNLLATSSATTPYPQHGTSDKLQGL